MDGVDQWNRVLTLAEIAQLYGGGAATAKPLSVFTPEPATGALGISGLVALLRRRR